MLFMFLNVIHIPQSSIPCVYSSEIKECTEMLCLFLGKWGMHTDFVCSPRILRSNRIQRNAHRFCVNWHKLWLTINVPRPNCYCSNSLINLIIFCITVEITLYNGPLKNQGDPQIFSCEEAALEGQMLVCLFAWLCVPKTEFHLLNLNL